LKQSEDQMFTIVIKFIKTTFRIIITWISIIESVFFSFNFYSCWNRIMSKCVISRFIQIPKNRNVLVVKFFMSILY